MSSMLSEIHELLLRASLKKIAPSLVMTFRLNPDLLKTALLGDQNATLEDLQKLSAELIALGESADRSTVQEWAESKMNSDTADEFMCSYRMHWWAKRAVGGCVTGQFEPFVTTGLGDALNKFNENRAVIEQGVLADLYTDEQLAEAENEYAFASFFLDIFVPEFVKTLGDIPSFPQIMSLIELEDSCDRAAVLAEYGAGLLVRFIKSLELFPENIATEQLQIFRDLCAMPAQAERLKPYSNGEAVGNIGIYLLNLVTDRMPKESVFSKHLAYIAKSAALNPDDDLN